MRVTQRGSSNGRRAVLSVVAAFLLLTSPITSRAAGARAGGNPPPRQDDAAEGSPRLVRRPGLAKRFGRKVLDFLVGHTMYRRKQELLLYGPQFPSTKYDPSDFIIHALVNAKWPMAVEYELEHQSSATIMIKVKGAEIFTKTLTGAGMGVPQLAQFTLPAYEGKGPHPARIFFVARRDGRYGDERAAFRLRRVGAGQAAVRAAWKELPGLDVAGLGPLPSLATSPARASARQTPASGLNVYAVMFDRGPANDYVYTFNVGDNFNRWAADILTRVSKDGSDKNLPVRNDMIFEHPITSGQNPIPSSWNSPNSLRSPIPGRWDGRDNNRKKVPPGIYWVRVRVWYSANDRGDWVDAEASNPLRIN